MALQRSISQRTSDLCKLIKSITWSAASLDDCKTIKFNLIDMQMTAPIGTSLEGEILIEVLKPIVIFNGVVTDCSELKEQMCLIN